MRDNIGRNFQEARRFYNNPYKLDPRIPANSNLRYTMPVSYPEDEDLRQWAESAKKVRQIRKESKKKNKLINKLGKNFLLIGAGVLAIAALMNKIQSGEEIEGYVPTESIDTGGYYKGTDDKTKIKNKIIDEANRQGVDPNKALAIAHWETRGSFNPNAYNSDSMAAGIFQVTPIAAKDVGVDYNKMKGDVDLQIFAGVAYLKKMLNQFGGDLQLAAAAYNWGPGNVRTKGLQAAPRETRQYIAAVPEIYKQYQNERVQQETKSPQTKEFKGNLYRKGLLHDTFGGARISSGFGKREAPTEGASTTHKGIDLAYNFRQPVYSFTKGKVTFTGWIQGYGKTVIVTEPNGYQHLYAHLDQIDVNPKDTIKKGDKIGRAGNTGIGTGVHLHYSIIKPGRNVTTEIEDYVDPRTYQYDIEPVKPANKNIIKATQNAQTQSQTRQPTQTKQPKQSGTMTGGAANITEKPKPTKMVTGKDFDIRNVYHTTKDNKKKGL